MKRITRDQVHEVEPHRFVADASDLGWKPIDVPSQVETDLGNGLPLMLVQVEQDVLTYRQNLGCIALRVFND